MRENKLKRVALGLVLVAVLALSAWAGYDEIKSIPQLRQAYYWAYNLRYPPADLDELGDGGLKEHVLFGDPVGIAEDKLGNIYVSDRGRPGRGRVIWKLDNKGYARIIAGTGRRGGRPREYSSPNFGFRVSRRPVRGQCRPPLFRRRIQSSCFAY